MQNEKKSVKNFSNNRDGSGNKEFFVERKFFIDFQNPDGHFLV